MIGTTYIKVYRFNENDDYIETYEQAVCDIADYDTALVTYNGKIYIIDQNTGYMLGVAPTISKARGKIRDLAFIDKLCESRAKKDYADKIESLRLFRNA